MWYVTFTRIGKIERRWKYHLVATAFSAASAGAPACGGAPTLAPATPPAPARFVGLSRRCAVGCSSSLSSGAESGAPDCCACVSSKRSCAPNCTSEEMKASSSCTSISSRTSLASGKTLALPTEGPADTSRCARKKGWTPLALPPSASVAAALGRGVVGRGVAAAEASWARGVVAAAVSLFRERSSAVRMMTLGS